MSFCVNGHNTTVTGRYANRECKECWKLRKRLSRIRENSPNNHLMVPTYRFRHAYTIERATDAWMAHRTVTRPTAGQAARRLFNEPWMDVFSADEWCVALGTHLSLMYPELYMAHLREETA